MADATADLGKVMITPRGEYSPTTKYDRLDAVTRNGSSYLAIKDPQGNAPPNQEYWQLLAQGFDVSALDGISVNSEAGAYGIRYYEGNLQIQELDEWVSIETSGSSVPDNVLTEDDILNTATVTEPGFALDARQANPDISDTLANKIDILMSLYPTITITAPIDLDVSDTIITVSDGVNTYTGTFVNQICTIHILELGTYSITAGQYELSAHSANINHAMQRINIYIAYAPILYLYQTGDEYTNVTGGWIQVVSSTETASNYLRKESTYLFGKTDAGNNRHFYTTNNINLSNYKKIKISCDIISIYAPEILDHGTRILVATGNGGSTTNYVVDKFYTGTGTGTNKIIEIDITDISASKKIGIGFYDCTAKVYKVWLEP